MKPETIPKGDGIKVVIGTRTYLGPDWTHVDIDPFPLHAGNDVWHDVDIVADATNIPLPDNYADIVFSSECLEHFSWKKYQDVLKEWCRILKPGGMIRIEVPDFLGACKQLLTMDSLEGDRAMQQIFFAEQMNQYDFHFVGLTSRMLVDDFEKLGFEILDVTTADEWGLLKLDASKPLIYEDYLLKIDATKPNNS
jgi:predicted SAM-dependent methyltransferase